MKFFLIILLSSPCSPPAFVPIGDKDDLEACESEGRALAAATTVASAPMAANYICLPPSEPA